MLKAGHLNQDLARYELHRVWVVDATLKPGVSHIYSRRTFYIDEDSWAVVAIDAYDGRGELWRYAEQHNENWYNVPMWFGGVEVHNDLQSGRYIAMSLRNEEKVSTSRSSARPATTRQQPARPRHALGRAATRGRHERALGAAGRAVLLGGVLALAGCGPGTQVRAPRRRRSCPPRARCARPS